MDISNRQALIAAALAAALAATPAAAASAPAAEAVRLDIPAGPLGAAITKLGRDAGVIIAFDPSLVRNLRTPGLHGRHTAASGLDQLLTGTNLRAAPDGAGGFTLTRAREAGAPTVRRPDPAPPRPAAPPRDEAVVEELLVTGVRAVTATKTDTPVLETPQSISVISSAEFLDRNALNLQDTLRYSAGVAAESYGTDMVADSVYVRGFAPAYFLDGMMRNMSYTGVPRIEPYMLDRVELLRGPASILYGQGSAGGVINALTKRPAFERAGEIAVEYGSWDRKQIQADLTGPLDAAGTFAGRMVAFYRDADQQTDYLQDDRLLLAPSLAWRPGADTSLTLLATYQRDLNGSSQQFLPIAATSLLGGPGLPLTRFLGEPDFDRQLSRQWSLTGALDHRFTDALRFRSTTRYARSKVAFDEIYPDVYSNPTDPFLDADRRIVARTYYSLRSTIRTLTSDNLLQAEFETGPFHHTVIAGVDYLRFHEKRDRARGDASPIDIYAPVYGALPTYARTPSPTVTQTQLGLYLQDQIRYKDLLTLVLGVRRDRAEAKTEGDADEVTRATTFRAGLIGNLGHGLAPYVSYSESFQPVAGLDAYDQRFKPQRGRQWEAGVKWQPVQPLLLSAAVFDIRETNRPAIDPENPVNTIQTGRARSRGVEFEAGYSLPGELTLTAAYSYVDATVLESSTPAEIGAQFGEVPKHTASVWAMKAFDIGEAGRLRLGSGVRYVGPVVSTTEGWRVRTPGYTLVDALVAWERDAWVLSVRASNLLDKNYYAACRVYGDCFTGNGRNVIGAIGYRF